VDLVEGFAEIKERIQRLVSVEIPKLELCDVMSLKVRGQYTQLELCVVMSLKVRGYNSATKQVQLL